MATFTPAPSAAPRLKVYRQTHVNPIGMSATVQVTVMDASYWVWISVRTQGEITDEVELHQVTPEELRQGGRDATRAFGDVSISMPPTKFQKVPACVNLIGNRIDETSLRMAMRFAMRFKRQFIVNLDAENPQQNEMACAYGEKKALDMITKIEALESSSSSAATTTAGSEQ
ncbi:hypothetical protein EMPS_05247 [Entomortierella parvispora]|uniref:Uncharacterized protein n=1 Tax=Entomortierella parvispora TaxID=205924 RepID=A0A9P3HA31_9FUNG|nr:hypothetical protein EMPS_05247 [Entomortierella parvispora]